MGRAFGKTITTKGTKDYEGNQLMSEAARIADQLRRAFNGKAWHGDSVFQILKGVTAAQAAARPIKSGHTIWELVLHIAAWDGAVLRRMGGVAGTLSAAKNFPPVKDTREAAWRTAVAEVRRVHEELVAAVAALPDSRLDEMVPGKRGAHHTFYYMLHGVVQHELYHAGQIALLKKMGALEPSPCLKGEGLRVKGERPRHDKGRKVPVL
jgi:uncharacterized damage-inducible protein DinB